LYFKTRCSNYGAILYRLPDISTYWLKIANFLYPTCIWRPCRNGPVGIRESIWYS